MTYKLVKHTLDHELSKEFFIKKLNVFGFLTKKLFCSLDFSEGSFFTLLPPQGKVRNIHNFFEGGILKQEPMQTDSKGSKYQIVNSIKDELPPYLYELLVSIPNGYWVFEDAFGACFNDSQKFFSSYGISALNEREELEVCYVLNKNNTDIATMKKCIEICLMPIWFFLGILTTANLSEIADHQMTPERIQQIVREARILILNAYDGEGFVFWERTQAS